MSDDGADDSAAAVVNVPLAYLTPENQAAQRSLTLLGDRNANLPILLRTITSCHNPIAPLRLNTDSSFQWRIQVTTMMAAGY